MPARYVICPMISELDAEGTTRRPKVGTIADPGRPLIEEGGRVFSHYVYSIVAADGTGNAGRDDSICLALVAGHDMSALDKDPEIVTLLDVPDKLLSEARGVLNQTPNEVLTAGQKGALRGILEARGLSTGDLSNDEPFWKWASRYCESIVGRPVDIRGLTTRLVNE